MTVHLLREAKGREWVAKCGATGKAPTGTPMHTVAAIAQERVTCPDCLKGTP